MSQPRFILCALVTLLAACAGPDFQLREHSGAALLDFRFLGEYPNSVSRIRLSEVESGQVLWEVRSAEQQPQIWTVRLVPGHNASQLQGMGGRRYEVLKPAGGGPFVLRHDVSYRVEAWGKNDRAKVTGTFRFVRR